MNDGISLAELQLAARNHGMPLEALRHDITPAGLHYLLIHYDIPIVDAEAAVLEVGGAVERPLRLTLGDLRARPAVELTLTMECAGNGRALLEPHVVSQPWLREAVGTARWRGVPLRSLLEDVKPRSDATEVLFTGIDRGVEGGVVQNYERSLPLAEAEHGEALLAYEMNGAPLPPQHGFPLRLVVPGWYGMTNVKWLARVTVLEQPFRGYQQANGYRMRQTEEEDGEPLSRMLPRALMVPPGVPDFLTRERTVSPGECVLEGRAWSGGTRLASVEVSADSGETWARAAVDPDELGRWAWRHWSHRWEPPGEGTFMLGCRARDEDGNAQPDAPVWNLGGYANNAVQWIRVNVPVA